MATFRGNDGLVKNGVNQVAEVLDWSLSEAHNTIDDTVLGDTSSTHLGGLNSWSGSINCFWDDTDTLGQVAFTIGASVTLNLLPEGATTGDAEYTGTATIVGIERAIANDTTVTQSFTFTGNGELTIGTAA